MLLADAGQRISAVQAAALHLLRAYGPRAGLAAFHASQASCPLGVVPSVLLAAAGIASRTPAPALAERPIDADLLPGLLAINLVGGCQRALVLPCGELLNDALLACGAVDRQLLRLASPRRSAEASVGTIAALASAGVRPTILARALRLAGLRLARPLRIAKLIACAGAAFAATGIGAAQPASALRRAGLWRAGSVRRADVVIGTRPACPAAGIRPAVLAIALRLAGLRLASPWCRAALVRRTRPARPAAGVRTALLLVAARLAPRCLAGPLVRARLAVSTGAADRAATVRPAALAVARRHARRIRRIRLGGGLIGAAGRENQQQGEQAGEEALVHKGHGRTRRLGLTSADVSRCSF